jgi:hypothetical protein
MRTKKDVRKSVNVKEVMSLCPKDRDFGLMAFLI